MLCTMTPRPLSAFVAGLSLAAVTNCATQDVGSCIPGTPDCVCTAATTCDAGLRCVDNRCIEPEDSGTLGGGGSEGTDPTLLPPSQTATETQTETDPTGADESSSSGAPAGPCEGTVLRMVSYNIQAVGTEGSAQWQGLGSVLRRLGPDVACLEEIEDEDVAPLQALTDALGWGEPVFANTSPGIGGELRNACIGPLPITRFSSYGSELSEDPDANDVGRDFLGVRVEKDGCAVGILAIHAKSGQETIDLFRRQVEFIRLGQAIADARAQRFADALVVMGDFNEDIADPVIGTSLTQIPQALPPSYELGADIQLPMTYDPFAVLDDAGLTRLDPTHEDSDETTTWGVTDGFDGVRLDYVFYEGVQPEAQLVYDSCRDDGIDDPPAGAWLPLADEPLGCGVSAQASDHLPIVVELRVE